MAHAGNTTYVVDVGGAFVLVTRKRVKNVNIRVGPEGQALMSVPWHMPKAQAEQIARDHAQWFRAHVDRAAGQRSAWPANWVTGERLRVWGSVVSLRVVDAPDAPSCDLAEGELVLRLPAGSTAAGRQAFVERWLASELRARLQVLLPACQERVGVRATSVTLRRMKTRWGSCTVRTGRIRLNTALAECPPDCLEMVLVHELCHLLEANHGPRFHALMDLHCPSWRASQRWLSEHPPRVSVPMEMV